MSEKRIHTCSVNVLCAVCSLRAVALRPVVKPGGTLKRVDGKLSEPFFSLTVRKTVEVSHKRAAVSSRLDANLKATPESTPIGAAVIICRNCRIASPL